MAFEATRWRQEQAQQHDLWVAWHIAALQRSKRLPALKSLLRRGSNRAKPLRGAELQRRRAEFAELKARMGASGD